MYATATATTDRHVTDWRADAGVPDAVVFRHSSVGILGTLTDPIHYVLIYGTR